ncbi:MAG: hypothetical protein FJ291_03335 [Planctomycetes bacterium]|nr:hypothetical protein [Planctomycetota bacterium]
MNNRFRNDGTRYQATVPDTLDLAERAALAIRGLGGIMDPAMGYMPFWSIQYATRTPYMYHYGSASITCDPKTGQSWPLLRLMSGSRDFEEVETLNRAGMSARVEEGLYWDRYDPARPWRSIYGDSESRYGKGRNEDFCVVGAAGIMARAAITWWEQTRDPRFERLAAELVAGMRRVAILKDDYAYYPEKGGWGEPCTYPRSGWLNTDEPQGATDGAEGDIACYQANQMYAAAEWYAITGDREALDLATRLARFCMKPKLWGGVPDPDREHAKAQELPGHVAAGLPDPACTAGAELGHWFSHFHARAITLRGLLEYGRATGDERTLEFVQRAYEFTLSQGIARMGWINCYPAATDTCEGCALGDQVALGIRLSDAGLGDYWDNVDAVVRNQLVEDQWTRADLLEKVAAASPEGDSRTKFLPGQAYWDNVISRSLGVFAGVSKPDCIPAAAYDWTGTGGFDSVEKDGLQFNNNRWAGEKGSMFVRFGPPTVTWWTTHSGNRRDFPVSAPNVAVGSNWGHVTRGSPFPMKLSEIEAFNASWSVTLPPKKDGQMFRVYYQLYFSDGPKGKYNKGDFAPTLYAVNCSPNFWAKDAGTHDIAGKKWKICDSATSSGMGRYMVPLLVPFLEPDRNGVIRIEDLDLKALIDWHVAKGYYSPDSHCMVVQAAWEIWVLGEDLKTNDTVFVIKKKGQPAVTIPAWSTLVKK